MIRSVATTIVVVVIGLFVWQSVLEALDARGPTRGRRVDAGGHRVRMIVSGTTQSGPTVILECGIGGSTASSWAWEQRAVERFARVVSYDRAGLGDSDPGPVPRDGERLVAELHAALGHAGLGAPYVFVGHSYGGLLARLFTEQYPDEVAGVVLVESSYPVVSTAAARPIRRYAGLLPLAPWAARLGLMRLYVTFAHTDADRLPEPERREQRAFLASSHHWTGIAHELQAWGPLTNPEAARTHGFDSRPLAVLTAESSARRWGGWATMQEQTTRLSGDSVHEIVPGATHGSAITDSTCAAFVSHAIRDVVTAVRERRRLRDVVAGR
jgi:pimeloyl-ACP methyl ester carboxylesterase